jgi:hypothetical protein
MFILANRHQCERCAQTLPVEQASSQCHLGYYDDRTYIREEKERQHISECEWQFLVLLQSKKDLTRSHRQLRNEQKTKCRGPVSSRS